MTTSLSYSTRNSSKRLLKAWLEHGHIFIQELFYGKP